MTTTANSAQPAIENLNRILAQHQAVRHLTEGPALSQFNAATVTLAQLHLFDILNRFDVVTLNKRLEEKPELFFPLINAFCNFGRLKLAREKFDWQKKQAEARQRTREEKQRARTPVPITVETLRSLKTRLQSAEPPVAQPIDPAITRHNEPPPPAPSPLVHRPAFGLPPSGVFSPTDETMDDICSYVTLSSRATRRVAARNVFSGRSMSEFRSARCQVEHPYRHAQAAVPGLSHIDETPRPAGCPGG